MTKNTEILTENEFIEAIKFIEEKGHGNKSLGGGLSFNKLRSGKQYFQFRSSVKNSAISTRLGAYPDIGFDEARKKATQLQKQAIKTRQKYKEENFSNKLKEDSSTKKTKKKISSCFKSLTDARKFIHLLLNAYHEPSHESRSGHFQKTDNEVYKYILLSLLNPTIDDELFNMELSNSAATKFSWIIYTPYKKKSWASEDQSELALSSNRSDYLIAFQAISPISNFIPYKTRPWIGAPTQLFPHLHGMGTETREATITEHIEKLWPEYSISLEEFKNFFKEILRNERSFSISKINRILNDSSLPKQFGYSFFELKAVYEWWASEIIRGEHAFKKLPQPFEGMFSKNSH